MWKSIGLDKISLIAIFRVHLHTQTITYFNAYAHEICTNEWMKIKIELFSRSLPPSFFTMYSRIKCVIQMEPVECKEPFLRRHQYVHSECRE